MTRRSLPLATVILSALLAGCGDSGPTRYPLSGKVTFEGKPVPRGTVSFAPDASKNNNGPGTMAVIKDGQYATEPGKGIVGGPHEIRISGFDGVASGDLADGKPLFNMYKTTVDFPKERGTHDFEVFKGAGGQTSDKLPPP